MDYSLEDLVELIQRHDLNEHFYWEKLGQLATKNRKRLKKESN